MSRELGQFREVWLADFEFSASPGGLPIPVCLVARELRSGRTLRLWQDELHRLDAAPYAVRPDTLFVAYYASAEMGCHLALGWPLPVNVLDLFAEFRNLTNGTPPPCGAGLLGALTFFELDGLGAADKQSMRQLVLRGGPWTASERGGILDYCESDVVALEKLLPAMAAKIDLPRALLRGRYMKALARMEHRGVPIDGRALGRLKGHWSEIQGRLIEQVDSDYAVFENGSFRIDRWECWLKSKAIPWPRLESGQLDMKGDTFKDMARAYPSVVPMRELRETLAQLRGFDLPVGDDGRNRCMLSAFSSVTGRNQPGTSKFIFGLASWLRGLIQPPAGHGLAYVDWSQQEFGIAAGLSNDAAMMGAYNSGDPYLAFAKQVGAVPATGSKQSHPAVREQFKAAVLAVQYCMGAEALALRINVTTARARELLEMHRRAFPEFWRWSDASVDTAMLHGELRTAFGWRVRVGQNANPRSLRNFSMQANGAEMLRLACCFATESGIGVCAPVHDAILIEAPLHQLDRAIAITQEAMAAGSSEVLGGFRLRSEAKVIRHPHRFTTEKGARLWALVWELIEEQETRPPVVQESSTGGHPVPLISSSFHEDREGAHE